MMRRTLTLLLGAALLVGLGALFAHGSGPAAHYWLDAPGWSRARLMTTASINAAAPLARADDGTLYLFTIEVDPERTDVALQRPYVRAFAADGEPLWVHRIPVVLQSPQQPQLILADDTLWLFWMDEGRITAAQVDTAGALQMAPTELATREAAGEYRATVDVRGRIALWYGGIRSRPGVYALPSGDPLGEPQRVDAEGLGPRLRYDAAGTLHAIWFRHPAGEARRFYHGRYAPDESTGDQATFLLEPESRASSDWRAHELGVDAEHLYLFLTELINTGGRVRQVETRYTYRSRADAGGEAPDVRPLRIPATVEPVYRTEGEYPGALQTGPRIPLAADVAQSTADEVVPDYVAPNATPAAELAAAFSAQFARGQDRTAGQVGVLYLRNGAPTSYQLLSTSGRSSIAPALLSDPSGDLYVTWLERASGGGGYHVYLASTAPAVREAFGRVTAQDAARVASTVLFNMLIGALVGPVALPPWLLPALLVLALFHWWRGERDLGDAQEFRLRAFVAILLFWAIKLVTLAEAIQFVPLAAWLPVMPPGVGLALRIGAPILIVGLSLLAARGFTRRVESPSVALFVTAYAVVDSLLTTAIYGSLLYQRFFPGLLGSA
jgi:hypothetical protein